MTVSRVTGVMGSHPAIDDQPRLRYYKVSVALSFFGLIQQRKVLGG